ncbi:hypothetical protein B9G69_006805 [Bdellovibrio sp. SKB1291214]|uniref:GFA family protein n=1 Tax=Bdellovibrio sp. SKB1291214 TaxID=1732569 RepID=UPI000B5192AB|nr:aldehyde-activating protein [Bdellovibrio sp. SKB1291214]UYL10287.1 hypothetical protein B9G69_006805 [Bdellovibrio sp. SKB1291214]
MIQGSCHCGNVKWKYKIAIESVTACNCGLCRRYGALWAYGASPSSIEVDGPTTSYAWANKHNSFHFCTTCGGLAYYISNKPYENGEFRAAVNFRLVEKPEEIQHLRIDHFDGFDKFEDLPSDGDTVKDLWF